MAHLLVTVTAADLDAAIESVHVRHVFRSEGCLLVQALTRTTGLNAREDVTVGIHTARVGDYMVDVPPAAMALVNLFDGGKIAELRSQLPQTVTFTAVRP